VGEQKEVSTLPDAITSLPAACRAEILDSALNHYTTEERVREIAEWKAVLWNMAPEARAVLLEIGKGYLARFPAVPLVAEPKKPKLVLVHAAKCLAVFGCAFIAYAYMNEYSYMVS
jgi:hypothetical protein